MQFSKLVGELERALAVLYRPGDGLLRAIVEQGLVSEMLEILQDRLGQQWLRLGLPDSDQVNRLAEPTAAVLTALAACGFDQREELSAELREAVSRFILNTAREQYRRVSYATRLADNEGGCGAAAA